MTETDKQQNVQYTEKVENVSSKRESDILYARTCEWWCSDKSRIDKCKRVKFVLIDIHQKLLIAHRQFKRFICKFSIEIRCVITACLEGNE